MKRYHLIDSAIISSQPSALFDEFGKFQHAKEWFPPAYKVWVSPDGSLAVGQELNISLNVFLTIAWRVEVVEQNHLVKISYARGWHTGHGIWRFDQAGDGTMVSFEIDIQPNNLMASFLYDCVKMPTRHSRDIQGMFNRLAARVGAPEPQHRVSKILD
jgi:hypothetical protein